MQNKITRVNEKANHHIPVNPLKMELNKKDKAIQMTGGGAKENRREFDFYPTPPECTIALIDHPERNNL